MTKKIFLIVSLFAVGACAAYFFLMPDPKKQADKALQHLKNNSFVQAEALINTLPSAVDSALYKGYLEQVKGCFDLAERYFTTAWNEAKKIGNPEILAEIALARASNAFVAGNEEKCVDYIKTARAYSSDNPAHHFFEALENYLRQAYGEALRLWNSYSVQELGDWMATSIDTLFSNSWKNIHLAHCLIEEGDVVKGREILEKESRLAYLQSEDLPLINLFLGYSYIKESRKVTCVDRQSFYRLAHFYFERAHVQRPFEREKNRIAAHIETEAATLLLTDRDDKKEEGLGFVHILQEWDCSHAVERLAHLLASQILNQKEKESVYLCQSIRQQFQGTTFHHLLTDKMLEALSCELKEGDTANLFYLWSLVEQLSPIPKEAARHIATLAAVEIFETIKRDDLLLTRTRNFMAFWEKLGRSEVERERMARDLLSHAKLFWHNEKQEKKGERLMEIALKITNHDPIIVQEIETFLSTLYVQAENSNMIRRLTLIYETMELFEINRQGLASKATVANHLADAEYLFGSYNYIAARSRAHWVLKLDPYNQGARRLAGLSSFHLRDYEKAICYLKLVAQPDEECDEALMLSEVFSCPVQEKHLCKNETLEPMDDGE